MSVVVRDPQSSEIFCLTKGADTTVMEVLQGTNENLMKKTISALDDFASDGLRKAKNFFFTPKFGIKLMKKIFDRNC